MNRLNVAVVFCIALGMAATAAVATLVDLTNFRAPPFPDAERLVRVWNAEQGGSRRDMLSYRDWSDLRESVPALETFEGAARSRLIWHLPGTAGRRVEGEAVSGGYFDLLGVRPMIGRAISAEEYAAGEQVLLLSHNSWTRHFDQDPEIVGRGITISYQNGGTGAVFTVIGVLGPDFTGTIEDDMPDLEFWTPLHEQFSAEERDDRALRAMFGIGKLAPGASIAQARAQVEALNASLAGEYAAFQDAHEFHVERFGANWREPFQDAGLAFGGAALLLLAVAVVNVALLLLTRASERRHEFAIRAALGAGQGRLARRVVAETLVLAAVGGVIGMVAAAPLLQFFLGIVEVNIPTYLEVRPGVATLAGSFVALSLAGLGASLLPAWLGARTPAAVALRHGGRRVTGLGPNRWATGLVVAEVALTVILVVGAALFARSYMQLHDTDLGFETDNRLRIGLFINANDVTDADLPAFTDRLYEHLRAQPGVRDVGLVWPTVPMLSPITGRVRHAAVDGDGPDGLLVANYIVHDRFFAALGMPLLAGRAFDALEGEQAPRTAIVSEAVAARFGGPQRALDQVVRLNDETPYRIVGVVPDARYNGALEGEVHRYEMYLSLRQLPRRLVSPIVHTEGDPAALAQPLTQSLAELAPNSAVDWVDPVNTFVAWLYRDAAFRLAVVAAFGISALLLTVAGLYAVLSQRVVRETAEIGVRKALGATDGQMLRRVLARGLTVAGLGVGTGIAGALVLARWLEGLLHADAYDPVAFVSAAAVLLAAATLACWFPGRRASRISPMQALREE